MIYRRDGRDLFVERQGKKSGFSPRSRKKNEAESGRFIKFGKISTVEAALTAFRIL